MEFAAANIWGDFHSASQTERGTIDDNANEVILGPRLNEAVRHWANGYLKRMNLGPDTKATDERAKLLDLHWGHVEHDGAQLQGLGAAMTNFAEVLGANVTKLAESWQGDSYNAFKTAIDKVQHKLAEYGAATTTTGDGLVNAMGQIRELYQTFADDSADKHLNFHPISPPEQWHKIGEPNYDPPTLAANCPSDHGNHMVLDIPDALDYNYDCIKDNDEQSAMINGLWVSQHRWDILVQDGCEESLDRVSIMYTNLVDQCHDAVGRIKGKLHRYFGAVNTTVDGVTGLYDVALSNVYKLGHAEAFTSLRIIGGQPAGGGPPAGGGDTSYPVDGGSYPAGSGDPGPASATEAPQPEPAPVEDPTATDPAATPPPAAAVQDPATDQQESVQIKDG
jgi:uncharacterized protein YukE